MVLTGVAQRRGPHAQHCTDIWSRSNKSVWHYYISKQKPMHLRAARTPAVSNSGRSLMAERTPQPVSMLGLNSSFQLAIALKWQRCEDNAILWPQSMEIMTDQLLRKPHSESVVQFWNGFCGFWQGILEKSWLSTKYFESGSLFRIFHVYTFFTGK